MQLPAESSAAAAAAPAEAPKPGLDHLNAILIARGYITRPLDFSEEPQAPTSEHGSGKKAKVDRLATMADLLTTILAERDADLELKTTLSAKVRALESSVDRKGKAWTDEIESRLDAERKETAMLAKLSGVKAELNKESSAHRSTKEDLMRLRRDVSSLKQTSHQTKIISERKAANLRSKLTELSLQSMLAKGCAADVQVIGGVFPDSARKMEGHEERTTAGQLAMDQVQELEEERTVHLREMMALRLMAVESVNCLREAGQKLAFHAAHERVELDNSKSAKGKGAAAALDPANQFIAASTSKTAFVGDLFPPLFPLGQAQSAEADDHPAIEALTESLQEVRHQVEQLETLRGDRSASLQRLLSRAKVRISEEAWKEASEANQFGASSSTGPRSSETSESASLAAAELGKQVQNLEEKLQTLQAAHERQTKMLEQSEEAQTEMRGLLEMYRQKEEGGVDTPPRRSRPSASSQADVENSGQKGKSRHNGRNRELDPNANATKRIDSMIMAEKLRELEDEKRRYILKHQALEETKAALEAQSAQAAASTSIQAAETSNSSSDRPSSRQSRTFERSQQRQRRSGAGNEAPAEAETSFGHKVGRGPKLQPSPLASVTPAEPPADETMEANGTMIDHGMADGTGPASPAPQELAAPSIRESAKKRPAPEDVKEADSIRSASEEEQAARDEILPVGKKLRLDRHHAASVSQREKQAADGVPRPPLASRGDVANDARRQRRRSSARIASLQQDEPAPTAAVPKHSTPALSKSHKTDSSTRRTLVSSKTTSSSSWSQTTTTSAALKSSLARAAARRLNKA